MGFRWSINRSLYWSEVVNMERVVNIRKWSPVRVSVHMECFLAWGCFSHAHIVHGDDHYTSITVWTTVQWYRAMLMIRRCNTGFCCYRIDLGRIKWSSYTYLLGWYSQTCVNSYSASRDNWCTVGSDGGCRVVEVRACTTSPMPDHKGFKLQ